MPPIQTRPGAATAVAPRQFRAASFRPVIVASPPRAVEQGAGLSFFVFCVYTFVLIGRPQDYVLALEPLRPALLCTFLSLAATVLLHQGGELKRLRDRTTRLYFLFFLGMLASVPFSIHRGLSFEFAVLGYSVNMIFYALFVIHVNTLAKIKKIGLVLVFAALMFAVMGLLNGEFVRGRYRIGGGMFDPNDVAFVVLSLLPFCVFTILGPFNKLLKALSLVAIMSGVLVALYTGSRGGLVGLLVFLLLFLLMGVPGVRKSAKILMILGLFGIAAMNMDKINVERYRTIAEVTSDYNTTSELGRVDIWKRGLALFAERPLIGVGVDRFGQGIGTARLEERIRPVWQAPHNSYVQVITETGIAGAGPFFLLIIACLRTITRVKRSVRQSADAALRLLPGILLMGFIAQLLTAFFLSQAYAMFFTLSFAVTTAVQRIASLEQEPKRA